MLHLHAPTYLLFSSHLCTLASSLNIHSRALGSLIHLTRTYISISGTLLCRFACQGQVQPALHSCIALPGVSLRGSSALHLLPSLSNESGCPSFPCLQLLFLETELNAFFPTPYIFSSRYLHTANPVLRYITARPLPPRAISSLPLI